MRQWVFDYQYVRKNNAFRETRTLIEMDGKKKSEKDADLPLTAARLKNPLFGPSGILGADWQNHYDFKLVREEMSQGTSAVVIETFPKLAFDVSHAFGRVWISQADSSVLKIQWDPRSIGNVQRVETIAKILHSVPRLTSFTEYGLVKNGIRFPSRDVTEEAYINAKGKKFVRSLTTVTFKDYKFFVVETGAQVKGGR